MKQPLAFLSIIFAVSFITAECVPRKHVLLCAGSYVTPNFPLLPDTVGSGSVYSDYQKVDTLTDGLCGDTVKRKKIIISPFMIDCIPRNSTRIPPTIIVNGLPYDRDLGTIAPLTVDTIYSLTKEQLKAGVIVINTKKRKK